MSLTDKAIVAFATPVLLGLVAWAANLVVATRLREAHTKIVEEAKKSGSIDPSVGRSMGLSADSLGSVAEWSSDALQIPTSILGPILALILLNDSLAGWLVTVFVVAIIFVFVGFLAFVFLGNPRNYERYCRSVERTTLPGVTPVLLGLVSLNLVLGVVTLVVVE